MNKAGDGSVKPTLVPGTWLMSAHLWRTIDRHMEAFHQEKKKSKHVEQTHQRQCTCAMWGAGIVPPTVP